MADQLLHIDHPDDERYDEIHIFVQERWKESELSGDEWRFSYVAEVIRKERVIITITSSKMEWMLQSLQYKILVAGEDNLVDQAAWRETKNLCDQPGCADEPVVFYIRKKRYTKQGEELAPSTYYDGNEYRQFCAKHRHRGDCALDDADHNYTEIDDPRAG